MSKNKIVEADLNDEDEANPTDAETGEPTFDDLSPRFVRNLDAAVAREEGTETPKKKKRIEEEDLDDDEDLDADEDADDEDEDEPNATADDESEEADPADEEDVDADEPRRGKPDKFEKRLKRSDRLVEEVRSQNRELAERLNQREQADQLAASESTYTAFKSKTDTDLARLKKELVAATENGETEKQIDLQDKITDLKADLRSETAKFETAKAAVTEALKRKSVSTIVATKVNQWIRKNPRYNTDPAFKAAVNGLDASLMQSGSDNESDEHYKELDRKLAKLYPELAPKVRQKQRRHPSSQQSRDTSTSQRRTDTKVRVKGGKLAISPATLARVKVNMQRFSLEPTEAEIKSYIQNNPGI